LVPLLKLGVATPCSIKALNNKRFIYFY